MKRIILALFLFACVPGITQTTGNMIAEDPYSKDAVLGRMPAHTYERIINLKSGQEIDLMIEAQTVYASARAQSLNARAMAAMADPKAEPLEDPKAEPLEDPKAEPLEDPMPKESFTNGWCFIEGKALANGCETTMISWCSDSKVHVVAITDCTLTIRGN